MQLNVLIEKMFTEAKYDEIIDSLEDFADSQKLVPLRFPISICIISIFKFEFIYFCKLFNSHLVMTHSSRLFTLNFWRAIYI